jgi:putative tryptophan/tyrosine transport system substrate-binding protein
MRRREVIALVGAAAMMTPFAARAQQAQKSSIGFFYPGPHAAMTTRVEAMLSGLRAAGHSMRIELVLRASDGDPTRIAPLVAEIVNAKVDLILVSGPEVLRAFRSATPTIPIVAVDLESDPVASGFAASIARPGSNITGVFFDFPTFTAKWIELLKEISPELSRIAVIWDSGTGQTQLRAIRQAAGELGITADVSEVRTRSDFEEAFGSARRQEVGAVLMLSSTVIAPNVQLLADLAVRRGLPAITLYPDFARAGGLLAYGPSLLDAYRQAGALIGKVLKGARTAELPIEFPTKFQLVVNMRTARTLRINIPTSVLLRADEVIE